MITIYYLQSTPIHMFEIMITAETGLIREREREKKKLSLDIHRKTFLHGPNDAVMASRGSAIIK